MLWPIVRRAIAIAIIATAFRLRIPSRRFPGELFFPSEFFQPIPRKQAKIGLKPPPRRNSKTRNKLQHAIQNEFFRVREGAVNELAKLLQGRHKGLALAAQQALEHMAAHDDSRRISNLAREALQAYNAGTLSVQQPAPEPVATESVMEQPATDREPEPAPQGAKAAQPVVEVEPTPVADERREQIREERRREEERKQELLKNLYEMGIQAMGTRDWKRSINAFQQVLDLDPEYREAARLLNLAREEQRKSEILRRFAPQVEATAEDTPRRSTINTSRPAANTPGQGKDAVIPEEIKKMELGRLSAERHLGTGQRDLHCAAQLCSLSWLLPNMGWDLW